MDRVLGVGALLVVLAAGAILVGLFALSSGLPVPGGPSAEPGWIGEGLWEVRGLDLAVQAFIVLAGVFGVLLVLGRPGEQG